MSKFTINKKTYEAKPFDYNLLSDLEEMGCPIEKMQTQSTNSTRAYFALCAGISKEEAGKELSAHVISGGDLKELITAIGEEIEQSKLFNAVKNSQKEE